MAVKLGNGNWAVKEDKLLAYNDNSGLFFNKEFDFSRGSTATYVGRDGLIASAASGVPRIDFTNDTKGHLLLEPSRTNYATNNSLMHTYSAVGGSSPNPTLTANYTTAPDGTNTATRLQTSVTGSSYSLINLPSTTLGDGTYSISVYVKSNTDSNQIISFYGAGSASSAFKLSVTTEWTRLEVQATRGSGQTKYAYIGTWPSLQGSDENIDISVWGAQVEIDSDYSTSLIPTTGAASTRNADVCNNSGSAQDFNSEEGVLYAELSALANGGVNRYISLSDNTSSNRLQIIYSGTSNRLTISGVGNVGGVFTTINHTPFVQNQFNKIAIKYSSSGCKVFVNGSEVGSNTDNTSWVKNALTTFDLTLWNQSTAPFIGKVRNVQVFTEALTDEQLEKLTS